MSFALIISLIACLAIIVSAVTIAIGIHKMKRLSEVEIGKFADFPLVSIIVPACNEEKNIEHSLSSHLQQGYPNLEVIAVNDRSIDNTAGVLRDIQARFPRLIVKDIDKLPEGWMGKNHALAVGAVMAKGEYLVFTDADVVLERTTIARAVSYMCKNHLDHLTLIFKNMTHGWLLNSLILDSGLNLLYLFRPWTVKKNSSRCFVGIGAFNMVRRSAYREIGGHQGFKMHPIDDLMLGKVIKEHGFFQDCLLAYDFVSLPWYDTIGAMIHGLEKNMFALIHYRVSLIPFLLLAIIIPGVIPVWGVFFGDSQVQVICLITVTIRLMSFYQGVRLQGLSGWYVPGGLITPYLLCYIVIKSACVTLKHGGIFWRGQYYALEDLRQAAPLFSFRD